jgi:GntR family transcriptional regulator, transcriptional repressor for pyruvate dehydrogenase complex
MEQNDSAQPRFVPLPEKRTFADIASQIRQMINSGILKPGDKLPNENELASQFRAGRLSVREALRMLEQAGLIAVKQGNTGGTFVKELDSTVAVESFIDLMWQGRVTIEDLTDARSSIEALIVTKAFRRLTKETFGKLNGSVLELERLVTAREKTEYPVDGILIDFHLLLAEVTGNPIFPIILEVLHEMTKRVIHPSTVTIDRLMMHAASHRAVLDALEDGDLGRALQAMENHMTEVGDRYVREARRAKAKKGQITTNATVATPERTAPGRRRRAPKV